MPQPHKGPRYARTIRFPLPLHEAIVKAAAEADMNVSDFVAETVARAHEAGLFPRAAAGQGRLPLSA